MKEIILQLEDLKDEHKQPILSWAFGHVSLLPTAYLNCNDSVLTQ